MSKKIIIITISVVCILFVTVLVVVTKVTGSSEKSMISGCVPYNVSISKGEENFQAVIEWSTQDECLGYVIYGRDRDRLDFIAIDTQELSSKNHRVVINKLLTEKRYFFLIYSGDTTYGSRGNPLSFSLSSL